MNGLSKQTWMSMWKPELETEAGMIFDALSEIHLNVTESKEELAEHPKACQKKYVTRNQLIIFILGVLAFEKVSWSLIVKLFM